MPEVLLGLGPSVMQIKGKFIDIVKVKKTSKFATLQSIYYLTSIFQGISLRLKQLAVVNHTVKN